MNGMNEWQSSIPLLHLVIFIKKIFFWLFVRKWKCQGFWRCATPTNRTIFKFQNQRAPQVKHSRTYSRTKTMREPYVCLNGDPRTLFMIFKRGEVGSLESDQVRQVGSRSKNVLRLATLSLVKVYKPSLFSMLHQDSRKNKAKKTKQNGLLWKFEQVLVQHEYKYIQ